ncbi:MAG TPA: 2,3-bisphosphoglycerate-independent phosphoglycerate mutase, partial [Myxococcota bacterium]
LNYANGDMVGHTGDRDASVVAVEAVDIQIGRLMDALARLQGALIVTADHGNCDEMFERDEKTGEPKRDERGALRNKTSHSLNPVPFYVFAPQAALRLANAPGTPALANLAATLLHLMGYAAPEDYAPSLLAD